MGLFDNSKKIVASSVTTKLMKEFDDPLPGIVAGSLVTKNNLVQAIVDSQAQGLYSRARNFYNYGKNSYSRGLPTGFITDSNVNTDAIRAILEKDTESTITLLYALESNDYVNHFVRQYLQDTRTMNPDTLVIGTNPSGVTEPIKYDSHAPNTTLTSTVITYKTVATEAVHTEVLPLTYGDSIVYQVQYQLVDDALVPIGQVRYWTYVKGTGTHPSLDSAAEPKPNNQGMYFPIVPFYEDKEELANVSHAGTPLYNTSKQLIKRMGFDYLDIGASLAEGTEESIGKNKGLYAYFYLGANATAGLPQNYATATEAEILKETKEAQATIGYLINFFILESKNALFNKEAFVNSTDGINKIKPKKSSITITDESFVLELSYFYIKVSYKDGNIGKVGWCTNSYSEDNFTVVTTIKPPVATELDSSLLVYRRQESTNVYVEVEVCGLEQKFTIFKNTISTTEPGMAFKDEDPNIICIPLNKLVVDKSNAKYRNRLIHAALSFVFNSYQIIEVKWYQQGIWSAIFTVVAIVLALPTLGGSFSIGALLTVAGITAAAYSLLLYYMKFIVMREITKVVVKALGPEATFALMLFLTAYGLTGKHSRYKLPLADQLLSFSTSMFTPYSTLMNSKIAEVQKDYAKMNEESDKLNKELETAKALLETDSAMEPWLFVNPIPDMPLSQSANSYYNQHLTANSGVLVLESPNVFTNLMLELPTIDETLRM